MAARNLFNQVFRNKARSFLKKRNKFKKNKQLENNNNNNVKKDNKIKKKLAVKIF